MASIINVLAVFGAVSLLYLLGLVYSTFSQFLYPSKLPRYLHKGRGQDTAWALVTGASDGIGRGIAEELAHRGFNVVLHGRNASKLAALQQNLQSKYPKVRFRPLIGDASVTGDLSLDLVAGITRELRDLNLTVLINNVGAGFGDRMYSRFLERPLQEVLAVMMVNECFSTLLTRALLPSLIENQPSLIVNVGSVLDAWPCAYLAPYSATKAHNKAFSESLSAELALDGHDIEVMHLRVLSVATPSSREELSALTISPRVMARGLLDRVGSGATSTFGSLRHAIVGTLVGALMSKSSLAKMNSAAVKAKMT